MPDLDFKQDYGDDELLRLIHASKPEFEPGRRWSYSNAGYIAAGIIIGKACGQHYGQVLRQRVFGTQRYAHGPSAQPHPHRAQPSLRL